MSQLKQVNGAAQMYSNDHNDYILPEGLNMKADATHMTGTLWHAMLADYLNLGTVDTDNPRSVSGHSLTRGKYLDKRVRYKRGMVLNCPALNQSPGRRPYTPNDSSYGNSITTYSINCNIGRFITCYENTKGNYQLSLKINTPGIAARASSTVLLVGNDYQIHSTYPLWTKPDKNYYNDWGIHPGQSFNAGMVDGSIRKLKKPAVIVASGKTLFYTL